MKRTNIVRLYGDTVQLQVLKLIGDRVSALWNVANFLCRQNFINGDKVPSYSELCKIFKDNLDYKSLPSDIAQEVLKKLSKAWISYFKLLRFYKDGKLQYKPGLPKYRKNRKTQTRPFDFIPIKSPRAYSIKNGYFNLTLPADIRNGRFSVPFKGNIRYIGKYKTCELKYDSATKNWYAYIVVEVDEPERKNKPAIKYATGDIGAKRTIALSVENSNISYVFSARELWKDYKYWTRQIAKEQSKLSQSGIKTSQKLKQLYRIRKLRLKHAIETMAKKIVSILKKNNVTHFKVGYPVNCRETMNFGKNNSLVHNFWAFDLILKILEKHCIRKGINFQKINESETSAVCHICGSKVKRPVRSIVICPKHGRLHADVNASLNMLKGLTPNYGDRVKATPAWVTYEWNKHSWVARAKSLNYLKTVQVLGYVA